MTAANKYLFALYEDPDMGILIGIVDKDFFAAEGGLESVHLSEELEAIWPDNLEMDELQESAFLVAESYSLEEVKAMFIEAGFEFDQAFQDCFGDI
jgi:hypothetical protein